MAVALDLGSYSDISDYSALVEKIKLWLDRGSELDQHIPTYISLIEDYLNDTLRTPDMHGDVIAPVVGGRFALPSDFEGIRSVWVNGQPISQYESEALASRHDADRSCVVGFSLSGQQGRVAPLTVTSVQINYWQRIPALTVNNPVNWLLDKRPAIYLYGALAAAEGYIENPERATQWGGLFEASVDRYQTSAQKAHWGSGLAMRSDIRPVRA